MVPALTVLATFAAGALVPSADAAHPGAQRHAHHRQHKFRADLDARLMQATYVGGAMRISFKIKNRGSKPAAANDSQFFVSIDDTHNFGDYPVGDLAVPALAPKQSTVVTGILPVPVDMPPSVYHVIGCADVGRTVKERTEFNNCRGTADDPQSPAIARADAGDGGSVAATSVSGGTCVGTLCGFTPGKGSVTFVPQADPQHRFAGWTGPRCTDGVPGAQDSITLKGFGTSRVCAAAFAPLPQVRWTTQAVQNGSGSVSASGTGATCDGAGAAGSCIVNQGGTVVLTATAGFLSFFQGWSDGASGPCDGVTSGNQVTISAPASDKSCVASFSGL